MSTGIPLSRVDVDGLLGPAGFLGYCSLREGESEELSKLPSKHAFSKELAMVRRQLNYLSIHDKPNNHGVSVKFSWHT